MDIITHLPVTEWGCDAIAMLVDCIFQYVYFVPCKSAVSTEELAQLFIATVMSWHGMPKRIISDRDGRFLSQFWQSLMSALGCDLAMSSAYILKWIVRVNVCTIRLNKLFGVLSLSGRRIGMYCC